MKPATRSAKPLWFAAIAGLVFFYLLSVRLDLFRGPSPSTAVNPEKITARETWMNILQQDRKIGYSHRRMQPVESGYEIQDTTYMRINTMGMVQDLHMRTEADLKTDLSLSGFAFTLRSNLFDLTVSGKIQNGVLRVDLDQQRTEIPLNGDIYLTGGLLDAAWHAGLETGQSRSFSVFDPATLGKRPVRITAEGEEILEVMGRREKTLKVSVDFMGTSQTAWIAQDGSVVREEGMMGITLERVTQQAAFDGLSLSPSQDLTRLVSLEANMPIPDAAALSRIRLRIRGIGDSLQLNAGRQTLNQGILTIRKESVPDPPEPVFEDQREFLKPTPFIESDHPEIQDRISRIVAPGDRPLEKIRKITSWIYENIEKRPVLSVPSALQTLKNRMGDCNEHAVLMAALARAAGIPAQIEAGLVYLDGRFYYHAWNVLYIGRWVTVDALMNQIPADVTHIRFVRGEPRKQIDLMGVIGGIQLRIVDKS